MKGKIPPPGFYVGKTFGALTVISENSRNWKRYLTCKCECGKVVEKEWAYISRRKHPSCGCMQYLLCGVTSSLKQFDPAEYMQKRFGRLLVTGVEFNPSAGVYKHRLVCMCDCGAQVMVAGNNLKSGNTKSCGCFGDEVRSDNGEANLDHGHTTHGVVDGRTPIYTCWLGIRECVAMGWRRGFHLVCHEYDPRWDDFRSFYSDFGDIAPSETIRRRDRSLPWSKDNCFVAPGRRTRKYPKSISAKTAQPIEKNAEIQDLTRNKTGANPHES